MRYAPCPPLLVIMNALVIVLQLSSSTEVSAAFVLPHITFQQTLRMQSLSYFYSTTRRKRSISIVFANNDSNQISNIEDDDDDNRSVQMSMEPVSSVQEEFSEQALQDFEAGQPSEWMVMKDLLGINIFTYVLAGGILFFFSMNVLLGPGWLGHALGIQGAGTINEMSDALPETIDLSRPDYLI